VSILPPSKRNYTPLKRRFLFLGLPAEVRITVYRHVFRGARLKLDEDIEDMHASAMCWDKAAGWPKGSNMGFRAPCVAIIFVSKLLLQEARICLFSEARIRIPGEAGDYVIAPWLHGPYTSQELLCYRLGASRLEVQALRHVVLKVEREEEGKEKCSWAADSLLASMPNLTTVTMHIEDTGTVESPIWEEDDRAPAADAVDELRDRVEHYLAHGFRIPCYEDEPKDSPPGDVVAVCKAVNERGLRMTVTLDLMGLTNDWVSRSFL
jgi:hypothetical protein